MTKSNRTITVSSAKEALAGWDGMIEVSIQKVGDGGIDGNAYSDIEDAVADFNESVTQYENYKFGVHMVILSKTWPEDSHDEYSSWKSEPVIVKIVGIGNPCTRRKAERSE